MTRRDYVVLAADLAKAHKALSKEQREGFLVALDAIIAACKRDNPRFDIDRFCDVVFA